MLYNVSDKEAMRLNVEIRKLEEIGSGPFPVFLISPFRIPRFRAQSATLSINRISSTHAEMASMDRPGTRSRTGSMV